MSERKPIEVDNWEPIPGKPGYVRRKGGRAVKDVWGELVARCDAWGNGGDGACYEYASLSPTWKDAGGAEWPEGETVVTLRLGGNEGYGVEVSVEVPVYDDHKRRTGVRLIYMGRFKLLSTRDDAKRFHYFVFDLFN